MMILSVNDITKTKTFLHDIIELTSSSDVERSFLDHSDDNNNDDTVIFPVRLPNHSHPLILRKANGESNASNANALYFFINDIPKAKKYCIEKVYDMITDDNTFLKIVGPDHIEVVLLVGDESKLQSDELTKLTIKYLTRVYGESSTVTASDKEISEDTTNMLLDSKPLDVTQGEHIPSLFLSLYNEGQYQSFAANSSKPFPFHTDIFEGQALFMINTKNQPEVPGAKRMNRYVDRFENTSFTFDIQVQGKFKLIPQGMIFVGAEITKRMDLSLMTRGMCGTILQIGRRMNAALHHSFGDKQNYELPHIVSPLWGTVDRLVITLPGESPPPMGQMFPESTEQRTDRRKKNNNYDVQIDVNNIYSFSVSTSNLDIVNWRLVNLPLLNALSLQTFWSDADLRLCAYCVPIDKVDLTSDGLPKVHPQSINQYCFAVDIKHMSNHPEFAETDQDMSLFEVDDSTTTPTTSARQIHAISSPHTNKTPRRKDGSQKLSDDVNAMRRSYISTYTSYTRPGSGRFNLEGGTDRLSESHSYNDFASINSGKCGSSSTLDEDGNIHELTGSTQQGDRQDENNNNDDEDEDEEILPNDEVEEEEDADVIDDDNEGSIEDLDFFDAVEFPSPVTAPPTSFTKRSSRVHRVPREHKPTYTLDDQAPYFHSIEWSDKSIRTDFVPVAIEVDDVRIGRPRARRTLYAFIIHPDTDKNSDFLNLSNSYPSNQTQSKRSLLPFPLRKLSIGGGTAGDPSTLFALPRVSQSNVFVHTLGNNTTTTADSFHTSSTSGTDESRRPPYVVLRAYNEWKEEGLKIYPHDGRPLCSYSRKAEVEQRRILLQNAFQKSYEIAHSDASVKARLEKFLSFDKHTSELLQPTAAGLISRPVRKNSITKPFMKESLVLVQLGNTFWSEECMGLTGEELVFVKPGPLGRTRRLALPLNCITELRVVHPHECPFYISGMYGMLICTFSRQYNIMWRATQASCEQWIECIADNRELLNNDIANNLIQPTSPSGKTVLFKSIPSPRFGQFRKKIHDSFIGRLANQMNNTTSSSTSAGNESNLDRSNHGTSASNNEDMSTMSTSEYMLSAFTGNEHMDLLVRPRGWRLGDRVVLNNRAFISAKGPMCESMSHNPWLKLVDSPVEFIEALLNKAFVLSALIHSSTDSSTPTAPSAVTNSASGSPKSSKSFRKSMVVANSVEIEEHGMSTASGSSHLPPLNVTMMSDSINSTTAPGTQSQSQSHTQSPENLSPQFQTLWLEFMDGVCLLQRINIESIDFSFEEVLCMYLNLYHCLLLHAFIVIGPPASVFKWPGFFGVCSYEAFGDIFSLAELEHCILKAGSPRPQVNLISQSFLPTSRYEFMGSMSHLWDGFPPWKLLWAINTGCTSYIPYVPVYTPDKLDEQLNRNLKESIDLLNFVNIAAENTAITFTLPQLCQWYSKWFDRPNIIDKRKGINVLVQLLPFCRNETKMVINDLYTSPQPLSVKYTSFNYQCRFIQPWPSETEWVSIHEQHRHTYDKRLEDLQVLYSQTSIQQIDSLLMTSSPPSSTSTLSVPAVTHSHDMQHNADSASASVTSTSGATTTIISTSATTTTTTTTSSSAANINSSASSAIGTTTSTNPAHIFIQKSMSFRNGLGLSSKQPR